MRPKHILAIILPSTALILAAHQSFRSDVPAADPAVGRPSVIAQPSPTPRFAPAGGPDETDPELDDLDIERRVSHHRLRGPPEPELASRLVPVISQLLDDLLRENQGHLGGVDCRGDGCMVELTWADPEAAFAQKQALLALGARFNCQPRFGLRPAPGAPGRALLFLDACQP